MDDEWNQDSELEANFELHDQIMEGNLEGASCFLQDETDEQSAARWREKAYSISKYAKEALENANKLREKIRYMNIQSREFENKRGVTTEEISEKKRTVIDICESQLGSPDASGEYSFQNESYTYTIYIFDCSWAGVVKKSGNSFGDWLTGGQYADVFAKNHLMNFITHYKNKHHKKENRSVKKIDLSILKRNTKQ